MKKLLLATALLTSCGTEQASDTKIVGGQRAPYMQAYARTGGCGATLIKSRWLVSAKHCGNPKKAIIGLYKRSAGNGGKPKEEIRITKIIKHPSWDLQLLKLERPSKFRPMKFANLTPRDGDRLKAFGFGQTSGNGSAPNILQGAVMNYNSRATKNSRPQIIRAGAPGRAVCFGDSGGPLIYKNKLIATATFTVGKCKPGGLGGFTRLDMGWIRRYING